MQFLVLAVILCVAVALLIRRNREHTMNAPLRSEIKAQVCFATALRRARILGTGGFGGTRGIWIDLRGWTRLTAGTDAFIISAPQALREFAFTGRETSISLTQMRFGPAKRDWIVITGADDGRKVQLAIMPKNLADTWNALAATGAALIS